MAKENSGKDSIFNFVEMLYPIAIGIGFTEFPSSPFKLPEAILFLIILFVAAKDWFYYNEFKELITSTNKFKSNISQIFSVLLLSQLFRQNVIADVRLWLLYLILFIAAGTYWNYLVAFENFKKINRMNLSIIFFNAIIFAFYHKIRSVSQLSEPQFKYLLLSYEFVVIGASYRTLA